MLLALKRELRLEGTTGTTAQQSTRCNTVPSGGAERHVSVQEQETAHRGARASGPQPKLCSVLTPGSPFCSSKQTSSAATSKPAGLLLLKDNRSEVNRSFRIYGRTVRKLFWSPGSFSTFDTRYSTQQTLSAVSTVFGLLYISISYVSTHSIVYIMCRECHYAAHCFVTLGSSLLVF